MPHYTRYVALIEELGSPAVVVGNSMGAGSAALATAERPDLIRGLVLVGAFVRNPRVSAVQRFILRVAMARPWAAITWKAYLPTLYAGRRPDDFEAYRDQIVASLRRPGYAQAFSLTTRTSHAPAEARLADVSAPTLVVMGEKDPDFPDPAAEARLIGERLHGEVSMIEGSGHYPQAEHPAETARAVLTFLRTVHADA